jgi:hypothetical protein
MESKPELLARFHRVKTDYDAAVKQMNRMKLGPARTRKAMWVGSLNFTLLQIKSDLEAQNHEKPLSSNGDSTND